MSALTLATCDNALPPGGTAPEWVHLLPAGNMQGRDGRAYSLPDPAGVILDFQERGIDLPVDYEHQNDKPEAKLKGPVPAAGWIKELAHNASGLWGRVEWTATAREMIGRKEYRYLSPSFFHNKSGQIMRLKGAGLVHEPNLHLKALASQEAPMLDPKTKANPNPETGPVSPLIARLAKVLNPSPDATEEEVMDALEAWLTEKEAKPDPKKFIPVEAVQQMLQERHLEKSVMAEGQAQQKVNDAIRKGYFPPALRDWAIALCREDASSFDAFLSGSAPAYAHLSQELISGVPAGNPRSVAQTEAEAAICAQLGLKPEQLATG
ncbi:phage protease [Pseudotabrizicola algicola]|uniref:Mu-like prophage I protein n=1 Tax=Pseudotabrizicola algicola TaxID=2709381 RepID=A0A6B3RNR1_9RHOB|nr:phage protease [Pseudotabrizicola algicola]NEX47737.1 hypothetical protein [Pseudotabrizicola algicola]